MQEDIPLLLHTSLSLCMTSFSHMTLVLDTNANPPERVVGGGWGGGLPFEKIRDVNHLTYGY